MMDCCEVIPNLLLGSKLVPYSYLREQRISAAVCMAPEDEVPTPTLDDSNISFYRFPVSFQAGDDREAGASRENLLLARDRCLELLRDGKRVYLHCVAGFNRSPAVACLIISRLYGVGVDDAMAFIRYFRNIAPEKHLALLRPEDL